MFITHTSFANILYIPYSPGGISDVTGRLIVKNAKELVLINKPGASGQLAINEMNSVPGAMLITNFTMFVTNPLIYKNNLSYDPSNYEVVATAGIMPGILACNKKTGINTIQDLINYKQRLVFGTTVAGGAEHLNTEILIKKVKKIDFTIIPYQGGLKHYNDMLGGHIDCVFGNLPNMLPFMNDSRLSMLISTHDITHINKEIPDWKTVFSDEFYFQSLQVILVDKRYNDVIKNKITRLLKTSMDTPEFKDALAAKGLVPLVVFGDAAIAINDKYNNTVKEFIVNHNILKE